MGQAKEKISALARFLTQHPQCCFCGAARPATTGDHVPGRAIFLERKWPEGYLFPACSDCNAATRKDELLIAVLARAFPNAETEVEQLEFRAALSGLANNWRDMLIKLRPTLTQKLASPMDVFNMSDPEIDASITKWGGKLGCALHYLHTGHIVPVGGEVVVWWQTNSQFHRSGFPAGLTELLHGAPELKGTNHSLKDQFSYLYGLAENRRGSIITCRLRLAMMLHLFVVDDVTEFPEHVRADAARPFSWPAPDAEKTGSESTGSQL